VRGSKEFIAKGKTVQIRLCLTNKAPLKVV
jgi:hypothetical protein